MYYQLNSFCIHQRGKSLHNDDYVYPFEDSFSADSRMFIICDGDDDKYGNQAAMLTCLYFSAFMEQQIEAFQTEDLLSKALRYAEKRLSEAQETEPDFRNAASTIAYLHLTKYGGFAAHVGNTRILHIRNGEIIYATPSYSEESVVPLVRGKHDPATLSVTHISEIKRGDAFIIASDGVFESISEQQIAKLLNSGKSIDTVKEYIDRTCAENSTDNYSLIAVQVNDVKGEEYIAAETPSPEEQAVTKVPPINASTKPKKEETSNSWLGVVLILLAAGAIITYWLSRDNGFSNQDNTHETSMVEELPANDHHEGSVNHTNTTDKKILADSNELEKEILNTIENNTITISVGEGKLNVDSIGDYSGDVNFALVKKGNKYGYVDRTNNLVIPIQYDKAERFIGKKAKIVLAGKTSYINYEGKILTEEELKKYK